MTDTTSTTSPAIADLAAPAPAIELPDGHVRVSRLLAGLQESSPAADPNRQSSDARFENELAVVRLGMATSLFYALRTKHAPTAAHSLRVALNCSAWAERMGLHDAIRDRIEVAALLHDLGKIGIPDRILRKPGKLSVDEQLTMDCCAQLGCEILRGCTNDADLLNIVLYASCWYNSRRFDEGPRGDGLPLGSRMLAIADAFDAMTTDTVYRPAMSRERAIQELLDGSGTQFDPELAVDFYQMLEDRPEMLQGVIVNRWLQQLRPADGDSLWSAPRPSSPSADYTVRRETLFYQQLVNNLKEGVVFTDAEGTITAWNDIMQDLTSIADDAIVGQTWSEECVRLRRRDSDQDHDCMVRECLTSGASVTRSMQIEQPGQSPTPVHVQASPVVGSTPGVHGAVIIIRDMTHQRDLEEQLESLHHQTTLDPLTGIANRAFFDQTLEEMTSEAAEGGHSFSLIMCDVDHFKRVNDVHGHQAGDEALVGFASILTAHSREGDLVARYGGEEFLLLAPNCDNATAVKRAEAIRAALENTPLPSIGNQPVTASFGVTEFQSGDSAATVVARADRALLRAKDNGRNRVIQLGTGNPVDPQESDTKKGWFHWFSSEDQNAVGEFDIVTPVPIDMTIEKLRGFVADHNAEVISVEENQVSLKLAARGTRGGRRRIDHQIALHAQLTLREMSKDPTKPLALANTNVHIKLQPIRNRDRRSTELSENFRQVVASLKSYLMGEIRKPSDV